MGPGDAIAAGAVTTAPIAPAGPLAGVMGPGLLDAIPARAEEARTCTWSAGGGAGATTGVEAAAGFFLREWRSGRAGPDRAPEDCGEGDGGVA